MPDDAGTNDGSTGVRKVGRPVKTLPTNFWDDTEATSRWTRRTKNTFFAANKKVLGPVLGRVDAKKSAAFYLRSAALFSEKANKHWHAPTLLATARSAVGEAVWAEADDLDKTSQRLMEQALMASVALAALVLTVLKPGSDAHAAAVTKAVTKKKPGPRKRNNDADWWPVDEGGDSDSDSDDSDFEDVAQVLGVAGRRDRAH